MDGSILTTIKKTLGYQEDVTAFDTDLIMNINASLMKLSQSGIGKEGFVITGYDEQWSEFIKNPRLESVKNYILMQTRLVFDPPASSTVIDILNKQSDEILWRLQTIAEEAENSK